MIFSHPADFTPVCTTELAQMARLVKEFNKRNVKTVCLSIDPVSDHEAWVEDIKKVSTCQVRMADYVIIFYLFYLGAFSINWR